nr:hypothetical protein Iba_chr01aCG5480 [Ipomoea batatas]
MDKDDFSNCGGEIVEGPFNGVLVVPVFINGHRCGESGLLRTFIYHVDLGCQFSTFGFRALDIQQERAPPP